MQIPVTIIFCLSDQCSKQCGTEGMSLPMIKADERRSLIIVLTAFSSARHAPMVCTPSLIVLASNVGGRDAGETSFPLMPAMTSNLNPVIEEVTI